MEACGINFFYLRAVFPLTLMLATASAQVCVPLGHSSLYFLLFSPDFPEPLKSPTFPIFHDLWQPNPQSTLASVAATRIHTHTRVNGSGAVKLHGAAKKQVQKRSRISEKSSFLCWNILFAAPCRHTVRVRYPRQQLGCTAVFTWSPAYGGTI